MLCMMQLTQCTLLLQGMLCLHLLSFLQLISMIDYETVLALCSALLMVTLKAQSTLQAMLLYLSCRWSIMQAMLRYLYFLKVGV